MSRANRAAFLDSEEADRELEASNEPFWEALLSHVRRDGVGPRPRCVIDVGAHRGGLLELIARAWAPSHLYGIEPIPALRKRSLLRLTGQAEHVELLDHTEWSRIPTRSANLLFSVESLYLVEDLAALFAEIARVLASEGKAYIVLGCHAENPVWTAWRPQLEALGHTVSSHQPMDILRSGAERQLLPSVRPLRESGWVTHDPRNEEFSFSTVSQMLQHHFAHKLLFRFVQP